MIVEMLKNVWILPEFLPKFPLGTECQYLRIIVLHRAMNKFYKHKIKGMETRQKRWQLNKSHESIAQIARVK